jgi:hypothetical protein
VQVLLRKSTNVFKPWKPVLAVLTVDNYLHIFDLPTSKTITATTPIEEVRSLVLLLLLMRSSFPCTYTSFPPCPPPPTGL